MKNLSKAILAAILSLVVAACGTQASEQSQLSSVASCDAGADCVTFRVFFWEEATLSPSLRKDILDIASRESNATYAFARGAVSRNLGRDIRTEWQKGTARTVSKPVSGTATIPGLGTDSFTAKRGGSPQNLSEVIAEWPFVAESGDWEARPALMDRRV